MEPNIGRTERIVRTVVGAILIAVGSAIMAGYAPLELPFGILVAFVGIVFLVTAVTRRCLLNEAFGVDTRGGSTG